MRHISRVWAFRLSSSTTLEHMYTKKKMGLLLYVGNLLSDSGRSLDDGFRYRCCLLFLFFVSRRCWRLGVFRALSVWETEGACIARKHTYYSLHPFLSPCLMTFCIQTPFPLAPEPHSILGEKTFETSISFRSSLPKCIYLYYSSLYEVHSFSRIVVTFERTT